jgi:hypothetical protein
VCAAYSRNDAQVTNIGHAKKGGLWDCHRLVSFCAACSACCAAGLGVSGAGSPTAPARVSEITRAISGGNPRRLCVCVVLDALNLPMPPWRLQQPSRRPASRDLDGTHPLRRCHQASSTMQNKPRWHALIHIVSRWMEADAPHGVRVYRPAGDCLWATP